MGFANGPKDVEELQASMYEYMRIQVMAEVQQLFKPELFNRIDDIVFFHPLNTKHLHAIADLMIVQLQLRLSAQSIILQVSEAARAFLVKAGYEPAYGARPLRRTIQSLLEDMLAEALLRGTLTPGSSIIVDMQNAELCIRPIEATINDAVSIRSNHSQEAA
jgi:ATP-dependent Clp protease ATP-binding subunit ClpC